MGDAAVLADLSTQNRGFLAPWDPVRPEPHFTVAGQRTEIEIALARHEKGEAFPYVVLNDEGEIAGRLTLAGIVRGAFQSCSMSYWLAEDETGKGLATEAVNEAVSITFTDLELHRVQAETLLSNSASQSVLRRAKFQRYGLAPNYLRIAGRWQDHLLFQRLNSTE